MLIPGSQISNVIELHWPAKGVDLASKRLACSSFMNAYLGDNELISQCNGAQNTCSTCASLGLRCQYKAHLSTRPDQKREYISALESRVAQLESMLSALGQDKVGNDHWSERHNQRQGADQVNEDSLTEALSTDLEASSSFKMTPSSSQEDQSSMLPSTRVYATLIKTQTSRLDLEKSENLLYSIPKSKLVSKIGKFFMTPTAASRLLEGWIKHLSTQYPVIHTPQLKELHARRDNALDIFEESILHLVYANSSRVLEAVSLKAAERRFSNQF